MPALNDNLELKLKVDTSLVDSLIAEIKSLLENRPDLIEFFLNGFESIPQLAVVDGNVFPAAVAGELLVMLKPAEQLVSLVAAARARNI